MLIYIFQFYIYDFKYKKRFGKYICLSGMVKLIENGVCEI